MNFRILNLDITITKLEKWPPQKWSRRQKRALAKHIEDVRPPLRGGKSLKIARIKTLREHFGYTEELDEFGHSVFRLSLKDAKELCELLWLDDGKGEIA